MEDMYLVGLVHDVDTLHQDVFAPMVTVLPKYLDVRLQQKPSHPNSETNMTAIVWHDDGTLCVHAPDGEPIFYWHDKDDGPPTDEREKRENFTSLQNLLAYMWAWQQYWAAHPDECSSDLVIEDCEPWLTYILTQPVWEARIHQELHLR